MAGDVREQLPRGEEEWRWKKVKREGGEAGDLTHVVKVKEE